MNLFGPTTYRNICGNYYCLVVVDDYSIYTYVFFLHDKADTYDIFKKFMTRAENEFELKVKKVRSDNGSEFRNTRVEKWCDEKGIKHEFSTKYTPKQNGLVERKNRTLIDMARSMLSEYNVSDSFWAEAINTACHASNRLYQSSKANVMKVFFLDIHLVARLIGSTTKLMVLLKMHMMYSLMK